MRWTFERHSYNQIIPLLLLLLLGLRLTSLTWPTGPCVMSWKPTSLHFVGIFLLNSFPFSHNSLLSISHKFYGHFYLDFCKCSFFQRCSPSHPVLSPTKWWICMYSSELMSQEKPFLNPWIMLESYMDAIHSLTKYLVISFSTIEM